MDATARPSFLSWNWTPPKIPGVQDDSYAAWFFQQLQDFRSEGHLVDVTLCAEGMEIPCHRLVLSACTDYFRAMFRGGHPESRKDKIEMLGVNGEALESLVTYAYTSNINITMDNVQPLFEAANMLQVKPVEEGCEKFLKDKTEMWVMPAILCNAGLMALVFIASCVMSVGFTMWCNSLSSLGFKCVDAPTLDWGSYNGSTFYTHLAAAQGAFWVTFLMWGGNLGMSLWRWRLNRRARSQTQMPSTVSDKAPITDHPEYDPSASRVI
ncbi:KLHL24 [Branchiostoma lanceolatum]|uniref:KLHL24 protein n=1 Tax=Branchiostoma lanceolatum TaxID=7740 RepID=A0A8J9ZS83_BRALA|nr:KLHL24 [Branchiostoma lanceolatum]